jgi:hypothetical protein
LNWVPTVLEQPDMKPGEHLVAGRLPGVMSAAVVTTIDREAVDSRGSDRERSEPDSGVTSTIAVHERTSQTAKHRCDIESPVLGGPNGAIPIRDGKPGVKLQG